jgi:P27 family predicted phage terminase small subunit
MAQRKRTVKSSIAGQIETTKKLMQKIEPAYPLNDEQTNYFTRIVRSREIESWDDNHILLATNLAVTYVQVDIANDDIASRGLMTKSDRGTPVVNPAVTAKSNLMASVLQLNKALGLSASQKGISGQEQTSRNKAERQARDVIEAVTDDLI